MNKKQLLLTGFVAIVALASPEKSYGKKVCEMLDGQTMCKDACVEMVAHIKDENHFDLCKKNCFRLEQKADYSGAKCSMACADGCRIGLLVGRKYKNLPMSKIDSKCVSHCEKEIAHMWPNKLK